MVSACPMTCGVASIGATGVKVTPVSCGISSWRSCFSTGRCDPGADAGSTTAPAAAARGAGYGRTARGRRHPAHVRSGWSRRTIVPS